MVDYSGVPATVVDPDDSFEGWVKNQDGAFVVNEPQGAPGWFPANDDPNDKATYDFAITVPAGNVAIGNGRLLSSVTDGGKTTWRWREDSPMASYLTTATNGDFDLTIQTGPNGLPIYSAVDSRGDSLATNGFSAAQKATIAGHIAAQPGIIQVLIDLFGPYPFSSAGGGGTAAAWATRSSRRRSRCTTGRPPGHRRPRARAPVVRRQRDAVGVAGHLAQRGLRPLRGVDVHRADGRPVGAGVVRHRLRDARATSSIWTIAPRGIPGPDDCSRARPTPAAG